MKTFYMNYDQKNLTEKMRYPYRKGVAKKPSQKKIDSVKDRPLSSFNVLYCYFTIPFRTVSSHAVFSFIRSVIFKFFLPQYFENIHLRHTPVKHVDNELDEKVPFKPEHIHIYMDFINFWIRPLAMLVHRFGTIQGSKLAAEFLHYIKLTYDQAYRMYSICMTTTYRPACDRKDIKRLRNADPHFMCVPSLHISIICLCFSFYKMLFEREGFTEEEKTRWNKELYDHSLEIAETVLYLKQHSVNCIPAALYMITKIAPELFTPQDAVDFINRLFENADDVSKEDRQAIIDHIHFVYERFLLEGTTEDDWLKPVERWLWDYVPYYPEYAKNACLTNRENYRV